MTVDPITAFLTLLTIAASAHQQSQAQSNADRLAQQQFEEAERQRAKEEEIRQQGEAVRQQLLAMLEPRMGADFNLVSQADQDAMFGLVADQANEQADLARRRMMANLGARGLASSGPAAGALSRFETDLGRRLDTARTNIGLSANQATEQARQAAMSLAAQLGQADASNLLQSQQAWRQTIGGLQNQQQNMANMWSQQTAQMAGPLIGQWIQSQRQRQNGTGGTQYYGNGQNVQYTR